MDNTIQSLATLSICTGIRGLERGVERAIGPLRTIAYVEIEAFIIENLLAGMEADLVAPAPIWANLKTFAWEQFRGKVGLFMGGYPCQPFSTAGLRKGADDPRHLWPHIERGIRTVRPLCCFFENVRGHLDLGAEQVVDSLRSLGYAVESGIFTAEEVGAPHQRARLFILAILANATSSGWGQDVANWIGRNEINILEGRQENANRFGESGKELAHSHSDGAGTGPGNIGRAGHEDEREMERQGWNDVQRERSGGHVGDGGSAMANTDDLYNDGRRNGRQGRGNEFANGGTVVADVLRSGSQGGEQCRTLEQGDGTSKPCGSTAERGFNDRWPARPGAWQFDWEAPRTIESGLGCAINGYNFREDLLRSLGNGVVEQQAEYAFRILLKKHFA